MLANAAAISAAMSASLYFLQARSAQAPTVEMEMDIELEREMKIMMKIRDEDKRWR